MDGLRADAARNRARLLTAAYEAIAEDGLAVRTDVIARRAGVGSGTVFRHFPTKEDLLSAVIEARLTLIAGDGLRMMQDAATPGAAFERFFRMMVDEWGSTDRGLVEALASSGTDQDCIPDTAHGVFSATVSALLDAARAEELVRDDLLVSDVETLLVGCQAMRQQRGAAAGPVINMVINGMRPLGTAAPALLRASDG